MLLFHELLYLVIYQIVLVKTFDLFFTNDAFAKQLDILINATLAEIVSTVDQSAVQLDAFANLTNQVFVLERLFVMGLWMVRVERGDLLFMFFDFP